MPPRSKLRDVAKLAGVSLGSASRALSAPDQVRPATLARVEAAVLQLGYVRHGAARALALRRTFSVGAIFPTLNNPIYADSIQAIQQRLNARHYQLMIASHEYDREREVASVRNFIDRGVEGLLLVGTDHEPAVFEALRIAQTPYVLMWSIDDAGAHHCVGFDNQAAGTLIGNHLLDLGHQCLAVLGGQLASNERARYRSAGVRQAMAARGLVLPDTHILEQPFSFDGGRAGLRAALALQPRPSALICGTDILSFGACDEARRLGIQVPAQLSVTGFDDISFAAMSWPALTTVRVPISEIGNRSVDNLLVQIEGGSAAQRERLDIELIVRDSTGPGPERCGADSR
jgi:LacI family transcriptional regulator